MDVDDALGQENLKTTLIADQGADVILDTANQMENQVAVSTPGSNPFLTAQAQVANLRCQAYMQKMLAAELRQEAGRIAHDNVLVKRRTACQYPRRDRARGRSVLCDGSRIRRLRAALSLHVGVGLPLLRCLTLCCLR